MIQRPPSSTRTDPLFPYPTRFRARRYTGRAIFAGLIDADHGVLVGAAVTGTPARGRRSYAVAGRGRLRLSHRITNADEIDNNAFQPAIEMPRNDHWTWSQRISGVAMILASRSALDPPDIEAVHAVMPSNTPISTPA